MAYVLIALTILLTVYGQLVLKWQVSLSAANFGGALGFAFYLRLLLNPWVISGFAAAFGASLCWMGAISKMELSRAYPFMALNFVLVGLIAIPLFGEVFTWNKLIGLCLIIGGLLFFTQAR
ncbi:MAG TPA: EamA family transporter [Rhodanobacter sp.]|nr:EamA family transporter [Rhodanobacter sp.]